MAGHFLKQDRLKKKRSKAFSLPKMYLRDDFGSKFYSCTTKCRLEIEVLVLTIVGFILSVLLDLVAIWLVFGLKLPNHSSILLTITLSMRILSSVAIIVASFLAIRYVSPMKDVF